MNAFGIDYGHALSIVCLRDGTGPRARTRLVGDGFRAAIPHALSAPLAAHSPEDPLLWGSRALEASGNSEPLRPSDSAHGPWIEHPGAPLFWGGLMRRLTAYIGRVKPLPRNGYDIVVAVQSDNLSKTADAVKDLCHEAGFEGAKVVPAPHALLCRWMMEVVLMAWGEGEQTVASVCVGDDSIAICAYRVTIRGSLLPEVTASSRCFLIGGCGGASWTDRLLQEVANRWREAPDSGCEVALRDAASEFGARLSRAAVGEQVEWDGPLAERMFEPLRLSREECRDWPEVAPLIRQLPDILLNAAQAVSGRERLDVVLVGGMGAMWPFVADVAATRGPVWQSGFPLEDVARGAACWPEAGEPNSDTLRSDGSPSGAGLPIFEAISTPTITLELNGDSTSELVLESFETSSGGPTNTPLDFSSLPPTPQVVGMEENHSDDTPDEVEDDMPPSQRWRVN